MQNSWNVWWKYLAFKNGGNRKANCFVLLLGQYLIIFLQHRSFSWTSACACMIFTRNYIKQIYPTESSFSEWSVTKSLTFTPVLPCLSNFRFPTAAQSPGFVSCIYVQCTDLNYWIKLLSCIIEANGGHIGLSHINLHWYYWGSRRGFYRFRLLVGMDKHCVNEISFTNNFCFFLNLPVNNELGIVQDGRHEFIIKCFKPSQNH